MTIQDRMTTQEKMLLIFMVLICISALLISGILSDCTKEQCYIREDIAAVWKHEVGKYSVTIQKDQVLIDKQFTNLSYFHIIADVPKGSNMWYQSHYNKNWLGDIIVETVTIHIHSIDNINGAGWNHGKFGSGTTERIE